MILIINLIAAILLFWYPTKLYLQDNVKTAPHPFDKRLRIYVNKDLDFLVYSMLTAMVFLGPLSLWKYAYWFAALLLLMFQRLQLKFDGIVKSYLLFIAWGVISAVFMSDYKFQALMMLLKYTLPLLYLWLAYTAIKDKDDLLYFMKMTTIGMCIYAFLIGGFIERVIPWIYTTLAFKSGGLFVTYASLADYYSGLIVVPIGLYFITKDRKWLWAAAWVALSTLCAVVRTGLGGIALALSFLFFTVYKGRSIPYIAAVGVIAVGIVFTVPEFREKMFKDENVTLQSFGKEDASFETIQSNNREYLWDENLSKFYRPQPLTGAGLGSTANNMKNNYRDSGLQLVHSDYVSMLCDLGDVGLWLFIFFVAVTLWQIISVAWSVGCPFYIMLTGGMALGSCAGTFFSMAYDNVVTYAQQSYVLPFTLIGIYLKVKDLYVSGQWR